MKALNQSFIGWILKTGVKTKYLSSLVISKETLVDDPLYIDTDFLISFL